MEGRITRFNYMEGLGEVLDDKNVKRNFKINELAIGYKPKVGDIVRFAPYGMDGAIKIRFRGKEAYLKVNDPNEKKELLLSVDAYRNQHLNTKKYRGNVRKARKSSGGPGSSVLFF